MQCLKVAPSNRVPFYIKLRNRQVLLFKKRASPFAVAASLGHLRVVTLSVFAV